MNNQEDRRAKIIAEQAAREAAEREASGKAPGFSTSRSKRGRGFPKGRPPRAPNPEARPAEPSPSGGDREPTEES